MTSSVGFTISSKWKDFWREPRDEAFSALGGKVKVLSRVYLGNLWAPRH
jgi:hypothetical protein